MKKDIRKIIIDETYSSPTRKNYPTNKIVYNHFDKIWSIDLADMIDCKILNNKGFTHIFVIIDMFSIYTWCIPLKNKYGETITKDFSRILSTSKRKPTKIKSDRGAEFYDSIFQNFLKRKKIKQYSRFTDKGPSICERMIKTIRNLLKKPVFEKGNADWLSELLSVTKQYNNTVHNSITMTLNQAIKKVNEKEVYSNLQDKRRKPYSKYILGQLVRTADTKRVFSKRVSTNFSYKLYTKTEIIHDTIPSYRINYLPERHNENLSLFTKLSLEEKKKL